MAKLDITAKRGNAPGDQYSAWLDSELEGIEEPANADPMQSEEAKAEHKKLLEWWYYERDKQSVNRLEMSLDNMFYDNEQWDEEDSAILRDRGQMPLVYNEIAPMIDWLIGTERRTRVDWRVLPRAEDDVESADVKTKVLKYVSDVNRSAFERSRAFADSVKVGLGWVDDGARDDPTQDILYSKYQDWRNVLHDSNSYNLDLSDARYVFRWAHVDEDVALAMLPDQADKIKKALSDQAFRNTEDDESWYLGEQAVTSGTLNGRGSAGIVADAKRNRVKLIEAQYRKPCTCKIIADGPMKGSFLHENDNVMKALVEKDGSEIIERVAMRVHVALFTEADMLSFSPSTYRHNRFSLTPIWCYRRGRDRLPYGFIRRVRDIQQDINKRASKALFMLNTNQIIAEEGATDDWKNLRDEADRPDGLLIGKAGKRLDLERDTQAANGQIEMMQLGAQSIQKIAGVNNENLGRATNAVSGAAIEARQSQGAVGTTECFDNLRFAVQVQGEKQMSLTEQFYTEEKVIRLTGARGKIDWVSINKEELQPDGTTRLINDISASQADFVVSEADYAGTMRNVMFDSLNEIVQKMPPDVGLRVFTLAMEFSDLPNKDAVVEELRKMTGDPDPNKEATPEQEQQAQQQAQLQAEAIQMQREQSLMALEEQRAKLEILKAEAARALSDPENQSELQQVQQQAAQQIDELSAKLQQLQYELANKTMQIEKDADVRLEIANINADTQLRIAEIKKDSDAKRDALSKKVTESTKPE